MLPSPDGPKIFTSLDDERLSLRPRLGAPMERFYGLFGTKSNEHTENDDADLAGEVAPPMQRLWNVDFQRSIPPLKLC